MNHVDPEGQAVPSTPESTTKPESAPAPKKERVFIGTGLFWGLLVGVLLAVSIIILAAQNTERTTIEFLSWSYSTPLIAVILGALLTGVVLDELAGLVYRARRRRTLSERDELRRLHTDS